jgi:rod shape-determining protein MreC
VKTRWLGLAGAVLCWLLQVSQPPIWKLSRAQQSSGEVASLQAQVENLNVENERLRGLLSLPRQGWKKAVTARCVRRTHQQPWSDLWLDRGSLDGLNTRCVGLHSAGLVGRLVEVGKRQSRLRPITHPQARVPVQVKGLQAVTAGQGWRLLLEEVRARPLLEAGSLVTTSGLGEVYPGSILVGRLRRVLPNRDPMWARYEVEPSVSPDEVLEVLLVEMP